MLFILVTFQCASLLNVVQVVPLLDAQHPCLCCIHSASQSQLIIYRSINQHKLTQTYGLYPWVWRQQAGQNIPFPLISLAKSHACLSIVTWHPSRKPLSLPWLLADYPSTLSELLFLSRRRNLKNWKNDNLASYPTLKDDYHDNPESSRSHC